MSTPNSPQDQSVHLSDSQPSQNTLAFHYIWRHQTLELRSTKSEAWEFLKAMPDKQKEALTGVAFPRFMISFQNPDKEVLWLKGEEENLWILDEDDEDILSLIGDLQCPGYKTDGYLAREIEAQREAEGFDKLMVWFGRGEYWED